MDKINEMRGYTMNNIFKKPIFYVMIILGGTYADFCHILAMNSSNLVITNSPNISNKINVKTIKIDKQKKEAYENRIKTIAELNNKIKEEGDEIKSLQVEMKNLSTKLNIEKKNNKEIETLKNKIQTTRETIIKKRDSIKLQEEEKRDLQSPEKKESINAAKKFIEDKKSITPFSKINNDYVLTADQQTILLGLYYLNIENPNTDSVIPAVLSNITTESFSFDKTLVSDSSLCNKLNTYINPLDEEDDDDDQYSSNNTNSNKRKRKDDNDDKDDNDEAGILWVFDEEHMCNGRVEDNGRFEGGHVCGEGFNIVVKNENGTAIGFWAINNNDNDTESLVLNNLIYKISSVFTDQKTIKDLLEIFIKNITKKQFSEPILNKNEEGIWKPRKCIVFTNKKQMRITMTRLFILRRFFNIKTIFLLLNQFFLCLLFLMLRLSSKTGKTGRHLLSF